MSDFIRVIKISIYITLVLVVVSLLFSIGKPFIVIDQMLFAGINFLYVFVLTLVNMYFNSVISKLYCWDSQPKKRLVVGSLGSIVITIIAFGFLRWFVEVGVYGKSLKEFITDETPFYYIVALVIAIIVSLFLHAFYFYRHWQENRVKEQKIIAGTASAKFDALKNQLDPHFLFNSLNVLTSLIEEDPHQAQKFTTSLSKVYRYVLEQKSKHLVTVDEELQFARTYVRLLKMRFEDSIVFEIPDRSTNPEARIVPLSLQLLLENAVKHNVATSERPLHIKVHEKGGMLVVCNNIQEKQVVKKSSGVGLRNIQQRYHILTDRKVNINKTASEFSVQLPMLTKPVSVMKTEQIDIEDTRYQKAKEHVAGIKAFYSNLMSYCIVIPILTWLNYSSGGFPWVLFPALGWGFGVAVHGLQAFGYNPLWGKGWEERKIKEYLDDNEF